VEFGRYMKEFSKPKHGKSYPSILYMPIRAKTKTIGVISVQSHTKAAYSNYHIDILRAVSVYVGIALDNAGLYANMEDRVRERTKEIEKAHQDTRLIAQISKDISESLNIETIIARVYENINTLMDATCFGMGIYDPDDHVIRMPDFIENGEKLDEIVFDVNDKSKLASWCFNNKKEVFITDFINQYSQYVEGEIDIAAGRATASILYLPLISKEKAVGVLSVQSFDKDAYNEYHLDILRGLGTTIAGAIENALLYESLEDKVNERTLELLHQKEIIEDKNKSITDSIIYAKRIQDATLPDLALIRSYLEKSFVLFRPKDIVSGDFY